MKASALLEYGYKKMDPNLLPKEMKDGLGELVNLLDLNNVESKELWFEIHCDGTIDFIIEISDFTNIITLCNNIIEGYNKNASLCGAWGCLRLMLVSILGNPILSRYIHVLSLEYDMEILLNKSFVPCVFLEFDVDLMEEDGVVCTDVYKEFDKVIYRNIFSEDSQFLTEKNVLSDSGIKLWNVGFMFTRVQLYRLFFAPISIAKFEELKKIVPNLNSIHADDLADSEDLEILLDCNYSNGKYSSFGMSYYYFDQMKKTKVVENWLEAYNPTESVKSTLMNWRKKEIVHYDNCHKLVIWQIAHFKIKEDATSKEPKLYLRVMER